MERPICAWQSGVEGLPLMGAGAAAATRKRLGRSAASVGLLGGGRRQASRPFKFDPARVCVACVPRGFPWYGFLTGVSFENFLELSDETGLQPLSNGLHAPRAAAFLQPFRDRLLLHPAPLAPLAGQVCLHAGK